MKEKDSFVFYRSFADSINFLPTNLQLPLYKAITSYALDLVEPNFGSYEDKYVLDALWAGIRPQLDANYQRYLNGCKGGCPPGTAKPSMIGNQNARKKQNQNKTKTKPNYNDNDNDNNNDNDNDKEMCSDHIIDDWRHLSSARLDYLRNTGQSVVDFKRLLLRQEVNAAATELGLSQSDIEAFMQKWGESSPGSDKIRAEYEATFNTYDRAKNYKGVGKKDAKQEYPDGVYNRKNFTDEEIKREFEFNIGAMKRLKRGESVKRINGKWIKYD